MSRVDNYIKTINQEIDNIVDTVTNLPEEKIRWKPDNDVWSIKEILAHVEEANNYWMSELKKTINAPDRKWGRGLQHEGRLSGVKRADQLDTDEIIKKVEDTKKTVEEAFSSIKEADLKIEAEHVNPKFGIKPLTFLVDHFMVEHLQGHQKQIERNIGQYNSLKV